MDAFRQDHEVPAKYGMCGDETTGPGGTLMAQCAIPVTLGYCDMIAELCPDAWAISCVNPTNHVADAVRRTSKVKFIAICDCFPGFVMELEKLLDVKAKQIRARAMGINHLTWLTELNIDGSDGYPRLKERFRNLGVSLEQERQWEFTARLMDTYGYVNIGAEHCRMLWEHDATMEERKKDWVNYSGWWTRFRRAWEIWPIVDDMIAGARYDENSPHLRMHHSRHEIGIMVSIIANEGREWGGINFPNNGAVCNMPRGAILEGSCIVDERGAVPVAMGDLPKPFVGITQHALTWQEMTVDAALSGDKGMLYQALLASPYVHDMKAAKTVMDELLDAHADLMPQFEK
jgi:6-phospho-beta-glucosidase